MIRGRYGLRLGAIVLLTQLLSCAPLPGEDEDDESLDSELDSEWSATETNVLTAEGELHLAPPPRRVTPPEHLDPGSAPDAGAPLQCTSQACLSPAQPRRSP